MAASTPAMKTLVNIASTELVQERRPFSLAPSRAAKNHAPAEPHPPHEYQSARALNALLEAFRIVGPALLDCVVELTIIVPEKWVLEVIHELDDRHCACRTLSIDNGYSIITAALPLRQSFRYRERLNILSHGMGSFCMRLSSNTKALRCRYPEITPAVAESVFLA